MAEATFVPHSMDEEYLAIHRFCEEHDALSYLELDHCTTSAVNLFALPEHEYFFEMERLADKIIAALPALKRILSKPITRLRETSTVLPIEAVRVINNATMRHISVHTEHWGNITKGGLKPRKLMTLANEEEYKIYENIALVRLVNMILSMVHKNIRLLQNIIYSCQPMNMNVLERTNHLMYFLAVGKLHVGYALAQDQYHDMHSRCLDKLMFISSALHPKLAAPVYRICKKDRSKLTLKKTNVFRLQKDYQQVYLLLKIFLSKDPNALNTDGWTPEHPEEGYDDYCTLLSLFALGHFHFSFDEKACISLTHTDAICCFKGWSVRLRRFSEAGMRGLVFDVEKNAHHSICLFFPDAEGWNETKVEAARARIAADEYLFADTGFMKGTEYVYLNLFDINSFRRIQQLVLRGMIYADTARDDCPFCGAPLAEVEGAYECERCKTWIRSRHCPTAEKNYFVNEMKGYRVPCRKENEHERTPFAERDSEAVFFYRNITALSKTNRPLCPYCGKVHG